MPKVLPEYLELRRQQILDAAAACFARRGFHQTTMQDICGEAELSPGAIYRYFTSKEEIIQAMCSRGRLEDEELMRGAMQLDGTLAILDELIRIYFSGVEDRELCVLMIELTSEARHNEFIADSLRQGRDQVLGPLREIVVQAQGRGEINPALDAASVANVMLGVYQGLVLQKLQTPEMDVEGYSDVVRALFGGRFWRGEPAAATADAQAALQH
jgi:AcrR family transcriptional regulator